MSAAAAGAVQRRPGPSAACSMTSYQRTHVASMNRTLLDRLHISSVDTKSVSGAKCSRIVTSELIMEPACSPCMSEVEQSACQPS